jgi:thioredoxin reductase (NADPH)
MAKPIILSVDDEPQVLNAVLRDLRGRYGKEYRIVSAGSGREAIGVVQQLRQRNDAVAMFLADQRMPEVSGTEFLAEARVLFPHARKVLLTAYADTEAAITSINTIELDYYLMKPWDPPEEHLYPVLDDLLESWWLEAPPPYEGIRVAGTLWSPASHSVKDFLARNRIPYQWLDIELSEEARALVEGVYAQQPRRELPVIFLPGGDTLVNPDLTTLGARAGLKTAASTQHYDLIIIGGGPAGLGAGVYGASEGLKTLMIERHSTGGQAGTSSRIENYLGFPKGVSGGELSKRATDQAVRLGCEILTTVSANQVRAEGATKVVCLSDGTEVTGKALIIATGVTLRELDVPGARELYGAGVYYGAALTEAVNYKDMPVFVIGGANSAGQGAMWFARYASQVTMLVRGSGLEKSMSAYLIEQINRQPNIRVLPHHEVRAVHGEQRLEQITYFNNQTGEEFTVPARALFIFIGAVAHTELVAGVVERNAAGFILTGQDLIQDGRRPKGWRLKRDPFFLETSVPGIFAAGDVRVGAVRRVASAVGQGAIAVSLVHQYLKEV